jgi:hypothetical protein
MAPEPTVERRCAERSGKPFLSVIMPVHDGAEWIAATLDSLVSEPTDGIEIIVIDSSSTDACGKIIQMYLDRLPIRLLFRPDIGPWQAKTNVGVELAAADFACMLHQDDLWLAGRVDAIRRWLAKAPDAVLHLAPTLIIDRNGRRMGRWSCPLPVEQEIDADMLLERLLVQNFVSVPAPVFRRRDWQACGGLDESLWYTADWDIWANLAGTGPVVYHHEVTTAFRVHGSSLTVTGSRNENDFRSQMQTVLDRHLPRLPEKVRRRIEPAAKASIGVNVSLAAASGGSLRALLGAAYNIALLGPAGTKRYLRDSRLRERVVPRLRAKLAGAF